MQKKEEVRPLEPGGGLGLGQGHRKGRGRDGCRCLCRFDGFCLLIIRKEGHLRRVVGKRGLGGLRRV